MQKLTQFCLLDAWNMFLAVLVVNEASSLTFEVQSLKLIYQVFHWLSTSVLKDVFLWYFLNFYIFADFIPTKNCNFTTETPIISEFQFFKINSGIIRKK
jgi:hypothetical protein